MKFIICINSFMHTSHKNVRYVLPCIVLLLCSDALYSSGINSSGVGDETLVENEFSTESLNIDVSDTQGISPPSLSYLTEIAMAKNTLQKRDFLDALRQYVDLQSRYGNVPDIVFGLGEVYYQLADFVNAQQYYSMVFNSEDDGDEGGFTEQEIISYYRNASMYFQEGNGDKYAEMLQYIITMSEPMDISIVAQARTEHLDRLVALYKRDLDYSYIAQRELGVYLVYTENIISDEAFTYLLAALIMATHEATAYLQTQEIGYTYTDLYYMIELLKKTDAGRRYLDSFYISRILIAIRKYYNSKEGAHIENMRYYITQLLGVLGYFESVDSFDMHVYSPILR